MIHDLRTQKGRDKYVEAMSKNTPKRVKDLDSMLTNEEIADFLLGDIDAYKEYIRGIIVGRLMDSSYQKAFWDGWFRGAEGKDLEDGERGIIYKTKQNN